MDLFTAKRGTPGQYLANVLNQIKPSQRRSEPLGFEDNLSCLEMMVTLGLRCLIIATPSLMCQWASYLRTLNFSPPIPCI
ncbi:hypothetical protein F2P79_000691 [Pimephales promelas]|nr:hypothetical protein F2P79_000691 [Pimephales promelas]